MFGREQPVVNITVFFLSWPRNQTLQLDVAMQLRSSMEIKMKVMCIYPGWTVLSSTAAFPTNLIQMSIGSLGSHVLRTAESQDGRSLGS